MPIVRVEMLAGRSPELKQRLAAEMTALPQPPRTSQNVPMNSAAQRLPIGMFVVLSRVETSQPAQAQNSRPAIAADHWGKHTCAATRLHKRNQKHPELRQRLVTIPPQ